MRLYFQLQTILRVYKDNLHQNRLQLKLDKYTIISNLILFLNKIKNKINFNSN